MKGILRGRTGRAAFAAAVVLVATVGPAGAGPTDFKGGGAVAGAFVYDGDGIPPSLGFECTMTTFDVGLAANVAVSTPDVYTGPVSFSGSGTSDDFFCDSSESGAGYVELSAFGVNAVGDTFSCASLSGWYLRAYNLIDVFMETACEINGVPTPSMTVTILATWTPTELTGLNITKAELAGGLTFGFPV